MQMLDSFFRCFVVYIINRYTTLLGTDFMQIGHLTLQDMLNGIFYNKASIHLE